MLNVEHLNHVVSTLKRSQRGAELRPPRRQSSEICYLSWREVLEAVEGQVCDQVPGVPDDGWRTQRDAGRAQSSAVPQAKGQTLLQGQTPHVPVDGFHPGRQTNTHTHTHSEEQTSADLSEKLADWIISSPYWSQVSVLALMTANTFTLPMRPITPEI